MKQFKTHTGEIIEGERLTVAQNKVADFWRDNAYAIRREDCYASHVTDGTKDKLLQERLETAERIRAGTEPMGFWLWQLINTELTGECVAFLPK